MSDLISGNFIATAKTYSFGTSRAGTPGCAVTFEVMSGPKAGSRVNWSSWFSEKTAERTIESLEAMGWKGDDPAAIKIEELSAEVEIVVKIEDWTNDEGRSGQVSKVQWVNSSSGPKLAQMSSGEISDFKSRMRGLVGAMRAKRGTKPQAADPKGDDKLRF